MNSRFRFVTFLRQAGMRQVIQRPTGALKTVINRLPLFIVPLARRALRKSGLPTNGARLVPTPKPQIAAHFRVIAVWRVE
jgi:hypothetical protein